MKSVGWATVLSLSVHGALGWAVMRAPAGWLSPAERIEPISIEIVAPPDPTRPPQDREIPRPPSPNEDPLPEEQPMAASARPRIGLPTPLDPGQEPSESGATEESTTVSSVDVPDVTPDDSEPRQLDSREMQVLLNPANVARGGYRPTGPGPTQRGEAAGLNGGDQREARTEEDIEREHRDHLRGRAMARPWLARERPEVRRQPDGSFAYDGHRFRARIRPDGSVDFEDHGNASTNGFSASGSFDLTDAIMGAAGQDPHAAERAWFMRNTRELRHRLEAEHRAEQNTRGLRLLRARVARMWTSGDGTESQRRFRIYSLWRETSDDDVGRSAREVIVAWIRENLPEGGDHAYTASELRQANAHPSGARFRPY